LLSWHSNPLVLYPSSSVLGGKGPARQRGHNHSGQGLNFSTG